MHEGESPFPGGSTEDGPDFGSSHQASYSPEEIEEIQRVASSIQIISNEEMYLIEVPQMTSPFALPEMSLGHEPHEHAGQTHPVDGPIDIRIEGEVGKNEDFSKIIEEIMEQIDQFMPERKEKKESSFDFALQQYHQLREVGYSQDESEQIVKSASSIKIISNDN